MNDVISELERAIEDGCGEYREVEVRVLKYVRARLLEQYAEIERLTAYNANLICANIDITNRHKDYVEDAERIARAEAITEFADRVCEGRVSNDPVVIVVRCAEREMKEAADARVE